MLGSRETCGAGRGYSFPYGFASRLLGSGCWLPPFASAGDGLGAGVPSIASRFAGGGSLGVWAEARESPEEDSRLGVAGEQSPVGGRNASIHRPWSGALTGFFDASTVTAAPKGDELPSPLQRKEFDQVTLKRRTAAEPQSEEITHGSRADSSRRPVE